MFTSNADVKSGVLGVTQTSFSIIITCFNQSAFIREAVQSALSQTYGDKEVIVVDDASTDVSLSILTEYEDSITLVSHRENGGASKARNSGASRAKGDFLVFLDGDDVLLPWALELYGSLVAAKKPTIILGTLLYFSGPAVRGSSLYFRSKTPVVNYDVPPTEITIVNYNFLMDKDRTCRACASALVVERQAFEAVYGWTEGIFPADDYDLMLKLGYSGRTIQIESPATVCYRVHAENSMRQVTRCTSMLCRVIKRVGSGSYTSGRKGRYDAYAFLGGPVLFWLRRAVGARCYVAAFGLCSRSLPLITIAALRRLKVSITGKRPVDVLPGWFGDERESKGISGGVAR
jgi:glycosyltransferase involved in cell wall biosynthesis